MTPSFPARWDAGAPELIADTFSSRVWRVRRGDGTKAVVKALKQFDDVHDELRGVHYLRWRDGCGAVRLLDAEGLDILLEDAGDALLSACLERYGDHAATEIAADVAAALFSPSDRSPPPELQPLRERYASLFSQARADLSAGKATLYLEAAELARRLLDAPHDLRPLHGDLHHENIIESPRGWLAIDAKGLLGDPAFDMANFFYNPLSRTDLCRDPQRIAMMAEVFSRRLGIRHRHLLDHAFAWGCLSAAWHGEDGNTVEEERELAIALAIREMALTS